jgi:hypothetical protein
VLDAKSIYSNLFLFSSLTNLTICSWWSPQVRSIIKALFNGQHKPQLAPLFGFASSCFDFWKASPPLKR